MPTLSLRNKLLSAAISGRLVEQRPEEGTADELLADIEKEKKRLIQERYEKKVAEARAAGKTEKEIAKIKPEKYTPPTPVEDDEKPFDIPESWRWVRLCDIFEMQAGKSICADKLSQQKSDTHLYPCYGGNGLRGYINRYNNVGKHCIVGRQGALCGNVNMADGEFYATEHAVVVSHFDLIDVNWTFVFLTAANLNQYATATAQPGLSVAKVLNTYIPLPPQAEQHRIVEKIEEILSLSNQIEANNSDISAAAKSARNKLLSAAIAGRLVEQRSEEGTAEELLADIEKEKKRLIQERYEKKVAEARAAGKTEKEIAKIKPEKYTPPTPVEDDEKPFDIPESWRWTKIGSISFCTKLAGFEYTEYIASNLCKSGVPLFKGKNVQDGKVVYQFESYIPEVLSDQLYRSQITRRCLLTPYVGTIGNIGLHDSNEKFHLGSNVGKIEFYNYFSEHIVEEYALYFLRSIEGYKQLTKHLKATAQASISIEAIRDCLIPLPPLAEQHRIVEKLNTLLPMLDKLNNN